MLTFALLGMELGTKSRLPVSKKSKKSGNSPVLVGFGLGAVVISIFVGFGVGGVVEGFDIVGPLVPGKNRFGFGGNVSFLLGYSFLVGIVDGFGVDDPGFNVGNIDGDD